MKNDNSKIYTGVFTHKFTCQYIRKYVGVSIEHELMEVTTNHKIKVT